MSTGEREELQYRIAAFQVDHIRAATLHDARGDALLRHEVDDPLRQLGAFNDDLEMKIALRVGDETRSEERAAQIRCRAALLRHELGIDPELRPPSAEKDPHVTQRRRQRGLSGHFDQVVRRLMQYGATHGQLGLQPIERMEQADDQPRHRRDVGGDFHTVAPGPLTNSVPRCARARQALPSRNASIRRRRAQARLLPPM